MFLLFFSSFLCTFIPYHSMVHSSYSLTPLKPFILIFCFLNISIFSFTSLASFASLINFSLLMRIYDDNLPILCLVTNDARFTVSVTAFSYCWNILSIIDLMYQWSWRYLNHFPSELRLWFLWHFCFLSKLKQADLINNLKMRIWLFYRHAPLIFIVK